jgi:hypothetical protein
LDVTVSTPILSRSFLFSEPLPFENGRFFPFVGASASASAAAAAAAARAAAASLLALLPAPDDDDEDDDEEDDDDARCFAARADARATARCPCVDFFGVDVSGAAASAFLAPPPLPPLPFFRRALRCRF